uniref:WD repeat and FYVE domain containing 1 n=1 Tax=Cyprinus carpio carpio TaxID=630221 RepID=A0A9J7ZHE1_CYPCA
MAAEIHSRPQSSRPVLLNKIEGHSDSVNAAVLIPKEDGVITVSEDRTIRVWLKRDSGQYWPSIYHTVSSPCSCMSYHHDSRRIFIGQDNGAVVEFLISEDFNKMNHVKTYPAHQNRVSDLIFSLESQWVISTGHDKSISWMSTQSGSMLGRHSFGSWASCLQYDNDTQHAFVGDYSGQITLLKLEEQTCSVITTLKGHAGSVSALYWDPVQRWLFSGASDHSVIMWDIGGRQGRSLLLQGHHEKVQALWYLPLTHQLLSCSADGGITVWNMETTREEAPQWLDSDSCQKCAQPFFWNIKQMWDSKTLGLRQHHCRKCGKAICGKCSSKRSTYPIMGFEFQVRVCDDCYDTIKEEDRTPLATFHEGKHNIAHMDMDPSRGLMVTCGNSFLRFLLLFSRQGKLGLQKWFTALSDRDKKIIRDITQMVLIVYRRSEVNFLSHVLFSSMAYIVKSNITHLLGKIFMSSRTLFFNFEKACFILDEFVIGGEVEETPKVSVAKSMEEADSLQETMAEYLNKPTY